MAKVMSPLYSAKASGKFMAMVFQSWRGLAVVREFEAPTQPNTVRQVAVRAIFTEISNYWANTLTEGLRTAWANFVLRWTDLWGNEVSLTGLNLFQKFNFILRDSGRAFQETTPPPITPPNIPETELVNPGFFATGWGLLSPAEMTKEPFVDVWIAGTIKSVKYDAMTRTCLITTDGLPQGVNPVKSDFRHAIYIPDTNVGTTNVKVYFDTPDVLFTNPVRIALILRRYNKHGNYSAVTKYSEIIYPV